MAPSEEAEPLPGPSPEGAGAGAAEAPGAAALLQAGSKAHQLGDLEAAEGRYMEALASLGVEAPPAGDTLQMPRAALPASTTLAEALHLLGALRIQRTKSATGPQGCDSDSEDGNDGAEAAPATTAAIEAAISLLRGALAVLPPSASATMHARLLYSLGLALLTLGGGAKDASQPKRSDAALAEAIEHLRAAARGGNRFVAWTNLAQALGKLQVSAKRRDDAASAANALEERCRALRAARRLQPEHPGVLYRLALVLKEMGQTDEAASVMQHYLQLAEEAEASPAKKGEWRTATVRHWLAVLGGDSTSTAPAEYVARLFDGYADKFDEHLVNALGYRTPELLAAEIRSALPPGQVPCFPRCGDLGCGTGLMAPLLRELGVERLEGVDLSAGMLAKAEAKGGPGVGYDRLVHGDLLELLAPADGGEAAGAFELLVAADVLVYVGDLLPVLAAGARSLARPHGLMVVSTEAPPRKGGANEASGAVPPGGFALADSGRYMHTAAYVRSTAEACGLVLAARRSVVLRHNAGKPVHGHIHVLRPATQDES